uniref:Uncharacterized protein n=1 Tax=Ditylenchus dipsaci TaxID=166011 RepID=A0A915CW97_9BILA
MLIRYGKFNPHRMLFKDLFQGKVKDGNEIKAKELQGLSATQCFSLLLKLNGVALYYLLASNVKETELEVSEKIHHIEKNLIRLPDASHFSLVNATRVENFKVVF